jgi:Domain of unknown function (DUF222)
VSGDRLEAIDVARSDVAEARRAAAIAMARLAESCVRFAVLRTDADHREIKAGRHNSHRAKAGEFVADEVSLLLREQPYHVRCLIARSRRLAAGLPTVWQAFCAGDLDAEQVRIIDRVARRASETHTLVAIDEQVVEAAQTRSPKQLSSWLLRLIVRLEPTAFERRHRRALAERRVTIFQGADGMGYVTGEVSAADAAAIDATLCAGARSLGKDDPRSQEQRRSDLFADLLLSRLCPEESHADNNAEWLEMEDIDPDTGELLATQWRRVDADGEQIEESPHGQPGPLPVEPVRFAPKHGPALRIGVVVPLASLLDLDDTPAELADRSAPIPAEELRQLISDTLGPDRTTSHDEVMFTRLLTDPGGRLLDVTELGRYASRRLAEAVMLRAGTCRFPTCSVPADRCDLDHHDPWPHGATSASNVDPLCRRHHRAKTFAWLASVRDGDTVEWTMPDDVCYRCVDEPMPVGSI